MNRFAAAFLLPAALLAGCASEADDAANGAEEAIPAPLADNGMPITALPPSPTSGGPSEPVSPVPELQPMTFPDFEAANMLGAGCLWRATADADHLFVFNQQSGVLKIDGGYVRLLPEAGSGELRYGTRHVYRGGQLTVSIEGGEDEPVRTGMENAEWPADMTVAVEGGAERRFENGILSCGA